MMIIIRQIYIYTLNQKGGHVFSFLKERDNEIFV